MVSSDKDPTGGGDELAAGKLKTHTPLHVSTSQRSLMPDSNSQTRPDPSIPKRVSFLKFGNLSSPSAKFHKITKERDERSRTVPSSSSSSALQIRERVHRIFSKKLDVSSLLKISGEWLRNPMNLALFVWILCVAVSGAILFMVMTGMLNHSIRKKSQRDTWFEVNNQILNALFTLMCLYQHPKRIYHLILLIRWRPEDVLKLRKIYCKNGTYKPHEWAHMMVVVILLHVNCFAQYALCGLNLGYRRSDRPPIGVGLCISVAIGAPAVAGIYSILSPLGKDYENENDEESQIHDGRLRLEKRLSFARRDDDIEAQPEWSGGVLDIWDDISLAYLSLFCSFCVFGWNMERLGFGNMYVHIATFLLFCLAPFWIFNLAAVNIDNETVRTALSITGIFLCVFGLLYGGFWRIRMRKRFNLPADGFCCGKPAVTDCALWLFCCWCSLAQEVRTGNAYDLVEDKFCPKRDEGVMDPLPREDGEFQSRPGPNYPLGPGPGSLESKDETMTPPGPSVIHREEL